MSIEKDFSLRTSCDDCGVFKACVEGNARDDEIIADLEVKKLMRKIQIGSSGEDDHARKLKDLGFELWSMQNETYKDDPVGLEAALKRRLAEIGANVDSLQAVSFDQLVDDSTELYAAGVRKKYRDVLINAVEEKGCEGQEVTRGGFLGMKVIRICRAPVTDVEKNLAANPPGTDYNY